MYTVQNGLRLTLHNLKLLSLLPPPSQSWDNRCVLPYRLCVGLGLEPLGFLQVRQVLYPQPWHQGHESVPHMQASCYVAGAWPQGLVKVGEGM